MISSRRLICKLDDQDVLVRGQQLAQAEHDYMEIEQEKKQAADGFKQSLEATQERILQLSLAVRQREEIRDVECTVEDDYVAMKHLLRRLDTGTIVDSYDFTEQERQGKLL